MEFGQKSMPLQWPVPRNAVENMHPYTAPLEGRRNLLRLDFNENTIGPSPMVIKALRNIPARQISIYPEYNGLQEAVVSNLSISKSGAALQSEQIGLFNGVDAAIHAIFHAYGNPNEHLLTTNPTFGYYTPCAHMQGMSIISIPYAGKKFIFPLEEIREALLNKKPKILLICNPNNPTGTRLAATTILELAKLAPKTLVVVDELYEAFSGDSVLPFVDFNTTQNLVVLRSLSKTAGLAGLRIGFAIANSYVIERTKRVTGPYDINSFAVIAALAALKDQDYVDNYVEEVLRAKAWLKKQLEASGTRHHMDGGNYCLIWPKHNSLKIETHLKDEGILVRNMNNKLSIENSLRVSIGTTKQMQIFWEVFMRLDHTSS